MISIIISIISLSISLFNLIYLIATNFRKINIDILNFTYKEIDNKFIYLFDISISNKSRQAISINSITLVTCNGEYELNQNPRKIAEHFSKTGNIVNNREKLFSSGFPVNISGLFSVRNFYEYDSSIELDHIVKIKIITNRGKIIKKVNLKDKYIKSNEFVEKYKNIIEVIGKSF